MDEKKKGLEAKAKVLKELVSAYNNISGEIDNFLSKAVDDINPETALFEKLSRDIEKTLIRITDTCMGFSGSHNVILFCKLATESQRELQFLGVLMASADICRERALKSDEDGIGQGASPKKEAIDYMRVGCGMVRNYLPSLERCIESFNKNESLKKSGMKDDISLFLWWLLTDLFTDLDLLSERIIEYEEPKGISKDYLAIVFVWDFTYYLVEMHITLMQLSDLEVSHPLLDQLKNLLGTLISYLSKFRRQNIEDYIRNSTPAMILDEVGIVFRRLEERRRELEDLTGKLKVLDVDSLLKKAKKKSGSKQQTEPLRKPAETGQEIKADEALSEQKRDWIKVSEAARIAEVEPGTISRWANEGKVKHNSKKKRKRRIEKTSLLQHMQKRKEREKGKKDITITAES